MFGIGGGEFIVIILIVLMFFGSDKIPEMARGLAKGLAQLKNATNDIKSEITKSVEETGFDPNSLTNGISNEIAKAKDGFTKMVSDSAQMSDIKSEIEQVQTNFSSALETPSQSDGKSNEDTDPSPEVPDGPIKRTR